MKTSHILILLACLLLVGTAQATVAEFSYYGATQTESSKYSTFAYTLSFDRNNATYFQNANTDPFCWATIDFNATTTHKVTKYIIKAYDIDSEYEPQAWQLQGSNDNSYFVVLDNRTGMSWAAAEEKTFDTLTSAVNQSQFRYYRIITTTPGPLSAGYTLYAEVYFYGDDSIAPAPVSSFTSTNISAATNSTSQGWAGIAPFSILLTDTSTNTSTSWAYGMSNLTAPAWTVANTSQNSVIVLPVGNWSLNLTATNAGGSNVSAQTLLVNVSSGAQTPISISSLSRAVMQVGSYLWRNDTSLYAPTAWCWTFGDSTFADNANGTKTYYRRGIYNVSSNVSNSAGFNVSYNIIRVI